MQIVLASASPRRKELLEMLGYTDLRIMPADCEEGGDLALAPDEAVCSIALSKARNVAPRCGDGDIVLAADTLVYTGGQPLGKPRDAEEAERMLRRLSGSMHRVYTGVALICGGHELVRAEATDVYFRELGDDEIREYIATGEPMDKAGAYGAQGRGAVFIERIDGDFFNVMGLPLCRLTLMLSELKGQL